MVTKAFENVKKQIGYCGIWCGSCTVGNGTLKELTQRYEALIRAYGLDHWGLNDLDFHRFVEGLEAIQRIPMCSGCLMGGGRKNCELRTCATKNALADCKQCHHLATCERIEVLQHMRSGALRAGLFITTEDNDGQQIIDKWTADLKESWPCYILFRNDEEAGQNSTPHHQVSRD